MVEPAKTPDWKAIEREYRAGKLSVLAIANLHGVAESTIRKRAKKFGWTRDLEGKVDDAIKGYLVPVIGANDGANSGANADRGGDSGASKRADEEFVDHAARRSVDVILSHRRDITEVKGISAMLLAELRSLTVGAPFIEEMILAHFSGKHDGAMREALRRALGLSSRSAAILNLTNTLSKLVQLERQAFGLEEKSIVDPVQQHKADEEKEGGETRDSVELARAILSMVEEAARKKAQQGTETKH